MGHFLPRTARWLSPDALFSAFQEHGSEPQAIISISQLSHTPSPAGSGENIPMVMTKPSPGLLSAAPDGPTGGTFLLTLSGQTHVGVWGHFFGTHQLGITSVIQDEVLWLEVPINDPFGMQVGKGFHHTCRVEPGRGILK